MTNKIVKIGHSICKSLLFRHLKKVSLDCGKLTILHDGKEHSFFGSESGPVGYIEVKDDRFFPMLALHGDIGLGEAYMDNYFNTDNLIDVVSFFILNREITAKSSGMIPSLQNIKDYIQHLFRDNSIAQGRKNIKSHYDIGNDFYKSFLDETMMYSSAVFENSTQSLKLAQMNKIDSIIKKARITASDHVLEIGSGWGGFSIRAVQSTGCRVTTITLSEEQKHYIDAKIKKLGLDSRIEVQLIDYRKVEGVFDKIVSIEMIEAVGHRHLSSYNAALEKLLSPNGLVVIQMISMPDSRYYSYRKSIDWIRKYIFPGGHLPSLTAFSKAMEKTSTLHIESVENLAPHYALTLLHWHSNFCNFSLNIAKNSFDDRFIKMWEYYLLSCSAAFSTRYINLLVLTMGRDRNLLLNDDLKQEKALYRNVEQEAFNSEGDLNQSFTQ